MHPGEIYYNNKIEAVIGPDSTITDLNGSERTVVKCLCLACRKSFYIPFGYLVSSAEAPHCTNCRAMKMKSKGAKAVLNAPGMPSTNERTRVGRPGIDPNLKPKGK